MLKKKYSIGVDLGGTNIAVGLVDLEAKKIVRSTSTKTKAPRSCNSISRDIASLCNRLCEQEKITMNDVKWVGAVTPGIINNGIVIQAVNLGWENVNFRKILATHTRRPVFVANDANAAAWAEAVWGCGQGASSLVAFTIGTGVGGGIVLDGKMWEGINGFAAELGHVTISYNGRECPCGRRGCIEAYCSATALVNDTKAAMKQNPDSLMWKLCGGDVERVNGKTAFLAKENGDKAGTLVVNAFIEHLAIGVSNVVNTIQPDVVCIGGGISREGDALLVPLRERVDRLIFATEGHRTKILAAEFKNDAGIFGAALLGQQEEKTVMGISEYEIVQQFDFDGKFLSATPFGSGHINDTKLIATEKDGVEKLFVLQRINHNVFKDPEALMNNYVAVTEYLRDIVIAEGGDPDREVLQVIKTKDGKKLYKTPEGNYWRLLTFISGSISYDSVERPEQFYDSAVAFGKFQYMLRDYPAHTLVETIPNFHNTPDRMRQFEEAVKADKMGRLAEVSEEVEFVRARFDFAGTFERAREAGVLPLKVTHNDTKLNNILFDEKTGAALCVVDLDTIMPGYAINDFGDSIRFGATTAAEDEADLSKVNFDISLYELYVKGFIEGANGGLTESELSLMPEAAIMMTFECGSRFLADYLNGDTYFKISRPGQNLDRARNQFKLVSDMEARLDEMHAIVKKYAK